MEFQRAFSGAPWEARVGYCRALRSGNRIFVTGTASMKDGAVFAPGDAYAQTKRCLEIIEAALVELGAGLHQALLHPIYVVGNAHHPVRVVARQVCFYQGMADDRGLLPGGAGGTKDVAYELF